MATISRLRTKPDRLRSDQAAELRQALLPFEAGEMAHAVRELIAHIDRQTVSDNGWTFVMISPAQNAAVVRWLRQNSSRPLVALEMWSLCFVNLDMRSGEILLSRSEIADAVGERVENVSRVMSELEKCGAISRKRDRTRVRYFMNPLVGTRLAGQARDQAQAHAPALRLV